MASFIDRLVYKTVAFCTPLAIGALMSNLGMLGGAA